MWRHGHTLEANLKSSVFRFVFNVWTSAWTPDVTLQELVMAVVKTHVNLEILSLSIVETRFNVCLVIIYFRRGKQLCNKSLQISSNHCFQANFPCFSANIVGTVAIFQTWITIMRLILPLKLFFKYRINALHSSVFRVLGGEIKYAYALYRGLR